MINKNVRNMVLQRDGKCLECGSTEGLTIDHIIPISRGGVNSADNLRTLCAQCNRRKGSRIMWSWFERIVMALHVDEICERLKNELKLNIAAGDGQARAADKKVREDFHKALGAMGGAIKQELRLEMNPETTANTKTIGQLVERMNELEEYLGIEYVVEHRTGYKKSKTKR